MEKKTKRLDLDNIKSGKVYIQKLDYSENILRCVTRIPDNFSSLLIKDDLIYEVEDLSDQYVFYPPQKIILELKNSKKIVLVYFVIYSQKNKIEKEEFDNKKIVFISGQWNLYEAFMEFGGDDIIYMSECMSEDSFLRSKFRSTIILNDRLRITENKSGEYGILQFRPSICDSEYNKQVIMNMVDSTKTKVMIMPRYSLGFIPIKDERDRLEIEKYSSIFESMNVSFIDDTIYKTNLEERELKKYFIDICDKIKQKIISLESEYKKQIDFISNISKEKNISLISNLIQVRQNKIFNCIVICDKDEIMIRDMNLNKKENLVFSKGTKLDSVTLNDREVVVCNDHEIPVRELKTRFNHDKVVYIYENKNLEKMEKAENSIFLENKMKEIKNQRENGMKTTIFFRNQLAGILSSDQNVYNLEFV